MTARSQAEDVAVVLAAAEAHRVPRPATDPIAAAHRMRDLAAPRHLAPFQSFEAQLAEWAAEHYGIVRDHAGRHLVEIGRAA